MNSYYLLMKKFHQNGGKSHADINSSTFDKSLLVPKPRQPKTNNFCMLWNILKIVIGFLLVENSGIGNETPNDNDKSTERERSKDSSVEKSNRSFILNYISLNSQKTREKMK